MVDKSIDYRPWKIVDLLNGERYLPVVPKNF